MKKRILLIDFDIAFHVESQLIKACFFLLFEDDSFDSPDIFTQL